MKQNNKMYGCAKNLFISLSQKEGISLKALKFHKTYLTPWNINAVDNTT